MNRYQDAAKSLITQYGDDAKSVAALKAAEFAAINNIEEWKFWEKVLDIISENKFIFD